jgi:hypothetical protein
MARCSKLAGVGADVVVDVRADERPAVPTSDVVAVLPLSLDTKAEPPAVVTDAAADGGARNVGDRSARATYAVSVPCATSSSRP